MLEYSRFYVIHDNRYNDGQINRLPTTFQDQSQPFLSGCVFPLRLTAHLLAWCTAFLYPFVTFVFPYRGRLAFGLETISRVKPNDDSLQPNDDNMRPNDDNMLAVC